MRKSFGMTLMIVLVMMFSVSIGTDELIVKAATVSVANESQLRAAVGQAGNTATAITLTADIELVSNFAIPSGLT